ncbi:MAG: sulfatase-like hydrolase/transferase [Terriglobales bacterium]
MALRGRAQNVPWPGCATLNKMRFRLVALLFCIVGVARAASAPDVYLITIDTLRADHVPCYGYERIQTPALNRLCRDGVRFSQAFTPSPITNSSHATILTGQYPSTHGVLDFGVPLGPDHVTWAELLKQRGYRTAAFIGAVILDSNSLAPGFNRGFDFYDNFPAKPASQSRWGRIERRGLDVVRRAENWLNANGARPRFVWVHLFDPHDPYEPPPPYSELYRDRPYDGEIAYADRALGEFFNYLQKQGRYQNALIIVVGDHGEGLGEHKEETHGIFLYDSTTHVPLIVKLPGGAFAGKTVTAQVRTTDILPTVIDLLGIRTTAKFDGESLKPYLKAKQSASRPALGETGYPLRFGWAPLRSVRADGFKFIEAPRPELYNLKTDVAELENIYEPWNSDVQKLRDLLASLRKPVPAQSRGAVPATTIAELRALGYLGPEGSTNVSEPSLLPDPKDKIGVQNLLHRAMLAGEDNRVADARALLLKALEADPRSPATLAQLGRLELNAANYAKAAEYLQRARDLRPDDSVSAFYQGQALEKTGDLAGARDALEASLKLSPGQFDARRLLGTVYFRMNELKRAADQLEAAVFLDPKNAAARLDLARVLLADKDYERAVAQLDQATRLDRRNADAFALLQEAYAAQGKSDLARQAGASAALLRRKKSR